MTRRQLLLGMPAFLQNRPQRVIVLMVDGLGADYITASTMPVLTSWQKKGIGKIVNGVMPSVTNANNTSICCGAWPEKHGITANFYLDETTGREEYMESADLVLAPTLFERARSAGVTSALLSSKKKTITLLPRGASIVLSAEIPTPEWTERLGKAPDIYSAEINHWLLKAALWILRHQPEVGVLYIHTTDYPMHMWPPEAEPSRRHLAGLDALLGELSAAAPDAAILLTADHGMHHKTRCWDLMKACAAQRRDAADGNLRRAGQISQTSQRLRRNFVGVPEIESRLGSRGGRHRKTSRRSGGADPHRGGAAFPPDAFPHRRTGCPGRSRHGVRQPGFRSCGLACGVP